VFAFLQNNDLISKIKQFYVAL